MLHLYNMPPYIIAEVGTSVYQFAKQFIYLFLSAVGVNSGEEFHNRVLVAYYGGHVVFEFGVGHASSFIQIYDIITFGDTCQTLSPRKKVGTSFGV